MKNLEILWRYVGHQNVVLHFCSQNSSQEKFQSFARNVDLKNLVLQIYSQHPLKWNYITTFCKGCCLTLLQPTSLAGKNLKNYCKECCLQNVVLQFDSQHPSRAAKMQDNTFKANIPDSEKTSQHFNPLSASMTLLILFLIDLNFSHPSTCD